MSTPNPIPLPLGMQRYSTAEKTDGPQKIKFVNPNVDNFERNIRHAAELVKQHGLDMPRKDQHLGRGAVGPAVECP